METFNLNYKTNERVAQDKTSQNEDWPENIYESKPSVDKDPDRTDKRVLAYVTRCIQNSRHKYASAKQETIAKKFRLRKKTIGDSLLRLVISGQLNRVGLENKGRRNPDYRYFFSTQNIDELVFPKEIVTDALGTRVGTLLIDPSSSSFLAGIAPGEGEDIAPINTPPMETMKIENLKLHPEAWFGLSRLELIEAYIDAGLKVTPLVKGKKIPPYGWTKKKLERQTKADLLAEFEKHPEWNVGAWMPANLLVVDVDDVEAWYGLNGGEEYPTLTSISGSGRGFHLWFLNPTNIGNDNNVRPMLDYKGNGCLVVLPPSVHKCGDPYRWENLCQPIEAPELIRELYNTRPTKKQILPVTSSRTSATHASQPTAVISGPLGEGERYPALFRIGRTLRYRMGEDVLLEELNRINRERCNPPLDERAMEKVLRDVLTAKDRPRD